MRDDDSGERDCRSCAADGGLVFELQLQLPGDQYVALPEWASWFMGLGAEMANQPDDVHSMAVLSVPTRAYASVFCLLGAVLAKYERGPVAEDHWKEIRSLPAGTWVRHLDRGRYYTCSQILGFFERGGTEWVKLTGGLSKRSDKCLDLQPLGDGEEPFNRRNAPREQEFLSSAMPGVDPRAYCASSEPIGVVVGSRSLLEAELDGLSLLTPGGVEGTARDLVRPRLQSGSPYRTDVVSSSAEELPPRIHQAIPLAVLDGGAAALRWRDKLRSRASIVVLDRTASSTQAAVDALLADRARSLQDLVLEHAQAIPPGVELMAYVERT